MGSKPVKISASRGAAILGISKYKTPVEAWTEIMEDLHPGFCKNQGFLIPEKKDPWNDYKDDSLIPLRWGLAFENAICDFVGNITDRERFFEKDFLTCHIDGIRFGKINENKTTNPLTFRSQWGEPGTQFVPEDIQIQIQHQLLVTELQKAVVNVLVFPKFQKDFFTDGWRIKKENGDIYVYDRIGAIQNNKFLISILNTLGFFYQFYIDKNIKLQNEMKKRYEEFWENHIIKKFPPAAKNTGDLKWLIPAPIGEIEANERIRQLWNEYSDIDEEIESSKKRMTDIKNIMAKFLSKETPKEHAEKGKIRIMAGARTIATYSISEKGRASFRINKIKKEI